jgi:hypothetical protein
VKQSGVVEIRNLKTDRVWLFWADDVALESASQRFKLDLGMHECASLQKDYTETGLEVFRFDLVEETTDRSRLDAIRNNTPHTYI